MAAIGAVATLLKAGDHVVLSDDVYGGTYRYFDKVLRRYDLSFSSVDTTNLENVERAIGPSTRMLYVETPTNLTPKQKDLLKEFENAGKTSPEAEGFFSKVKEMFGG